MPPALDRLLASPSALRLLRSIVDAPELPACHTTIRRCAARNIAAQRRTYANDNRAPVNRKWVRWSEQKTIVEARKTASEPLHDDDASAEVKSTRSKPEAGFDFLNDILGDEKDILEDNDLVAGPAKYWATRLAHQERLDGLQGIWSVWHARRRECYSLPIENSAHAQVLWGTFARHPKLVKFVIDHAVEQLQEKGETYPRIYSLVVGYWLVRNPKQALDYHHQILVRLALRRLPIRELAQSIRNYGHTAHEALLLIYRNSNERDVYDEVVPRLINCGKISLARRWHKLCIFRGDQPSASFAAHPVIQLFTAESSALLDENVRFGKTTPANRALNKDLMQRLLGRDTAPVRFEDAFTARMFATRTVQSESIIKGLAMVGVNEIGPLAVSAMARRAKPITELPQRFEELRAAGIALKGCVFSLALEKFATEQKWDLVQSILNSDQHPDVFGDAETQRSLLTYYLGEEDLEQARRTLAILALFHNEPSRESWNLLLQLRIKKSRPQDVFNTLLEMRSLGVAPSSTSMGAVRAMLVPRRRGHRPPATRKFDDLRFVTRFYSTVLEAGMAGIPPQAWHEIMRRFGMQSRFRELKRLVLWLLTWYAPRHSKEFPDVPRSVSFDDATNKLKRLHPLTKHYYHYPPNISQKDDKNHPIRILFPPSLIQGILVWGFRSGLLQTAPLEQSLLSSTVAKHHHRRNLLRKQILNRLSWTEGLKLVVQLRDLGVHIHPHTVTKTLQAQFINLFGYRHSRIKANRMMEHENTTPYAQYIREVNRIWGEPLFSEPQKLGQGKLDGVLWHPRFRRRIRANTEISLKQAMGEEWASGNAVEESGGLSDGAALDGLGEVAEARPEKKKD